MRVKVSEKASTNYIHRCYRHAHPQCGQLHRPEWVEMLRKIEGQWVDVETEHLFRDQFNTAPIPGVSDNGMRLMVADITAIEGDVRDGVVKCRWCYGYDRDGSGKCSKCGRSGHLEPLNPVSPVNGETA